MPKKKSKGALINPKVLYPHGLQLCLSLLRVHSWGLLGQKIKGSALDVHTLFGRFDLLCRHYRTADHGLEDLLAERGITQPLYTEPVTHGIERVDRIEGFDVGWDQATRIDFTPDDMRQLDALQRDWESVGDDARQGYIDRGVIFPQPVEFGTYQEPEAIQSFVFVRLPVESSEEFDFHRKYLSATIFLERTAMIRGIYWTNAQASYHCVVEVKVTAMKELVDFVMDDLQGLRKSGVETSTHISVGRVSLGRTPVSDLFRKIPREMRDETLKAVIDSLGRLEEVIKASDPEAVAKLEEVSERQRIRCVALFDRLNPIVDSIMETADDADVGRAVMKARLSATEAFLFREAQYFHQVGGQLGPCIERVLRRLLGRRAYRKFGHKRGEIQSALKLRSADVDYFPEGMTGGDVANAIAMWNRAFPDDPLVPADLLAKWKSFQWLRDRSVHARSIDFERGVSAAFDGFEAIGMFFHLHREDQAKYDYSWPIEQVEDGAEHGP